MARRQKGGGLAGRTRVRESQATHTTVEPTIKLTRRLDRSIDGLFFTLGLEIVHESPKVTCQLACAFRFPIDDGRGCNHRICADAIRITGGRGGNGTHWETARGLSRERP